MVNEIMFVFQKGPISLNIITLFCFCICYNGKPNVCLVLHLQEGYDYQDLRHHPPGSLPSAGAGEFC